MGPVLGLIGFIVFVIVFVIALGLFVRMMLRDDDNYVPVKRRELNRAKKSNASALQAIDDIETLLDSAIGLDIVGQALAIDVRNKIKEHRQRKLEIDK